MGIRVMIVVMIVVQQRGFDQPWMLHVAGSGLVGLKTGMFGWLDAGLMLADAAVAATR